MIKKVISVLLLAFVLINVSNGESERELIMKFFDVTDQYDIVYLKVALNNLHEILSQMADRVPVEHRGPSYELLHNYVNSINAVKDGSDVLAMRAQFDKLPTVGEDLQNNLKNTKHPENAILGPGMFAIMMFPFRMQQANIEYDRDMKSAAIALKERFTLNNIVKHIEFYSILEDIINKPDIANNNQLLKKFEKIEADYRAGRS